MRPKKGLPERVMLFLESCKELAFLNIFWHCEFGPTKHREELQGTDTENGAKNYKVLQGTTRYSKTKYKVAENTTRNYKESGVGVGVGSGGCSWGHRGWSWGVRGV